MSLVHSGGPSGSLRPGHGPLVVRILASVAVLVLTGMALGGAVGWLLSRIALYFLG